MFTHRPPPPCRLAQVAGPAGRVQRLPRGLGQHHCERLSVHHVPARHLRGRGMLWAHFEEEGIDGLSAVRSPSQQGPKPWRPNLTLSAAQPSPPSAPYRRARRAACPAAPAATPTPGVPPTASTASRGPTPPSRPLPSASCAPPTGPTWRMASRGAPSPPRPPSTSHGGACMRACIGSKFVICSCLPLSTTHGWLSMPAC